MRQPIITAEHVILREFIPEDAREVQELAGNYTVARYTLNVPHPYEDGMAESWISTHAEGWEHKKEITYAIILKDTGSLIGAISLMNITGTEAELVYWIGEPYWGNGYCTEAAVKLIEMASSQWGIEDFWAIHLQKNPASGAVMKKNGMHKRDTRTIPDRDGSNCPC
ncbi:GNAT family N-acetyltransferase [Chitinivibrio alkaliphilus]|uniref:GCN5-related N-acetyltransferase n=1 Tax=Chitinivibrio alkaliphilus ACht1 TaxID=1313304 RepID=U7DDS1_9BACT|nr:GNAT family N-acetyltransferase [Chitinivibrio alkaliphilus]ERP39046.1 GCN5-related N-acetyltransferase [Chitinivibrio alkaliphilus ACht1]